MAEHGLDPIATHSETGSEDPNTPSSLGVFCAGCGQTHYDARLLDANRDVRKHTYKSGVIVYCEHLGELYIVVVKQRASGFRQPFAKGSCIERNLPTGHSVVTNSLSTASRELLEETGIRACIKTLRGVGDYVPSVACKTTFFAVKTSTLLPLCLPSREIESVEWMRFDEFMRMIRLNPNTVSLTTRKMLPLVFSILTRELLVVPKSLNDGCVEYPMKKQTDETSPPVRGWALGRLSHSVQKISLRLST